ncbi:glycohydrolase toxin TNT-related protein [Fimbriiglobus ruber]|nr:glycohydrolase toxin TNT-related protein [Fimbriiglobus ruber]
MLVSKLGDPLHRLDQVGTGFGATGKIVVGTSLLLFAPNPLAKGLGVVMLVKGLDELRVLTAEGITGTRPPTLTIQALTYANTQVGIPPGDAAELAIWQDMAVDAALNIVAGNVSQAATQTGIQLIVHGLVPRLGRVGRSLHDPLAALARWAGYIACFAGGTPIRTPDGWRAIKDLRVGDVVLSRDEHNPDGPVEPKVIEEVFTRYGLIWELRVGGQVIRTTAEHPFYAWDKGWTAANLLAVGDRVLGEDGRWVTIEGSRDTGETEPVYNVRIADYHTYFVGDTSWGFSVWAHNVNCTVKEVNDALGVSETGKARYIAGLINKGDFPRLESYLTKNLKIDLQSKNVQDLIQKYYWPKNRGFIEKVPSTITLAPGATFDRYGGFFENGVFKDFGTFISPAGVPFEMRALPQASLGKPFTTYEVLKPIIDVKTGTARPWFGRPGLGVQHELPMPIQDLINQGFIKSISQILP